MASIKLRCVRQLKWRSCLPTHGSTFWVELPVQAEVAAPATLTSANVPAGVAPESTRPVTLLYVEDSASNQQVLQTMVGRLRPRWHYLAAADGVAGLEQARQQRPDLILLDLQLPGMKGDAVLSELRATPETNNIPVVMLSADATPRSRERLLAMGANDYVPKSFKVTELMENIETILRAQS